LLERVIEHWLTSVNEKTFQVPFSHILSSQGHTVVHISRHCGMELGKDILTIDKDGIPCAFQLKGGNISLAYWNKELSGQIQNLVAGNISHPSIPRGTLHRAFLVTNGKIEEEVARAVEDHNISWTKLGFYPLELIVGGNLVADAKDLKNDFWPPGTHDLKTLLELHLEDGRAFFPKKKLARLLEETLPFKRLKNSKVPSKVYCQRAISSAALLTSLGLSSFSEKDNYFAQIEAWTVFTAYVYGLAERWDLKEKYYSAPILIAKTAIENALTNLATEVTVREHYVEGIAEVDNPFYRIRITILLSMLNIHYLWRRSNDCAFEDIDIFIKTFGKENRKRIEFWGEAVVPQFLSIFWGYRLSDGTMVPDFFLRDMINAITSRNGRKGNAPLASPYFGLDRLLPNFLDGHLNNLVPHGYRLSTEPIDANFGSMSHTIEGLVHIFVRRNWKQNMKAMWPAISRIHQRSFDYKKGWHFYRWRNEEGGEIMKIISPKQSWQALKDESFECQGEEVPDLLKQDPVFALLFLVIFPHRLNASFIRWLDTALREAVH